MDYITIYKLQNKLEGEVNQNIVRKLIDKMTKEGFVEAQSNRRLGMIGKYDAYQNGSVRRDHTPYCCNDEVAWNPTSIAQVRLVKNCL